MNVRRIDRDTMEDALAEINIRYDGNMEWVHLEREGTGFSFRLRATDSRGAGGRRAASGRRLGVAACWHAHGYLFEAILARSPGSWVTTAIGRIDIDGGNWEDTNIGSAFMPMMMSDACECAERELLGVVTTPPMVLDPNNAAEPLTYADPGDITLGIDGWYRDGELLEHRISK